jgi:regulator of sigma E protease
MSIVWALLVFTLVVVIHEFGHYLLAVRAGITVTEFSIGMGPRLFSRVGKKNGVRFSIKLFPIGGSCAMVGEDEKSDDVNAFGNKPVLDRIFVVVAGPAFNFILAFIFSLVVIGFAGYDPAVVTSVENGSAAYEAGLKEGDVITKIGKDNITIGRDISLHLQLNPYEEGKPVNVTYKRDGKKETVSLMPKSKDTYLLGFTYMSSEVACTVESVSEGGVFEKSGIKEGDVITGINGVKINTGADLFQYFVESPLNGEPVNVELNRNGETLSFTVTPEYHGSSLTAGFSYNLIRHKGGFFDTIRYSAYEVAFWIKNTVKSLGLMISGKVSRRDISGPVGIVNMIGDTYNQSKKEGALMILINMANICILLSSNLGVMNLLPIPALDGGRLLFLIVEAIRRKPIPSDKEGIVHFVGFALLMVLMVFVFFNDILKIFGI